MHEFHAMILYPVTSYFICVVFFSSVFFDILEVCNLLTHCKSEYLSWSCKTLIFFISHTFQRKRYISVARTGNFIIYAQGPFLMMVRK